MEFSNKTYEITVATIFSHTTKTDLTDIQKIAKLTVNQSYRYFLDDVVVDQYLESGQLDEYLQNNIKNTWALYQDSKIIGFSICIENVIDFMLIDTNFHRQGFGTKLLKSSENLLFKKYKVIALESFESNTKAAKFYEANNWKETDKYKDPNPNATKVIYRKRISTDIKK